MSQQNCDIEFLIPIFAPLWCKENDLRVLIGDNDPKLHHKNMYLLFQSYGIELYKGAGKLVDLAKTECQRGLTTAIPTRRSQLCHINAVNGGRTKY